jgi:putative aldouronate transport system permease protein
MTVNKVVKPEKIKNKKSTLQLKDNIDFIILALPALLCFLIFNYLPMFGVIIAFKDYRSSLGILGSKWVGFDNFKFFFTSQDAIRITTNTLLYGVTFIVTSIITSVLIALLLFEIKKRFAIKAYQTIMVLPNFLSWVIVGYVTYILFNPVFGVFNQIITTFGGKGVDWYSEVKYWPFILTFSNIWKGVGMGSIVYYAALMGLDSQIYEAAEIDGAGRFMKAWHISIPSLVPLMTMLSILAVGGIIRGDFGLFYTIPRDVGVLYPVTDIIDTYVYRGLRSGSISATTAVGFFQSFVGLFMVIGTNAIVKKIDPERAMF